MYFVLEIDAECAESNTDVTFLISTKYEKL